MIQQKESQIQTPLRPGEQLLWSGKSRRGFMFHPVSIYLIIMVIFLFALVGGLVLLNNMFHFIRVIEHLTSGASARVTMMASISAMFIILGLIASWGFIFYPLQRLRTVYGLTDQRAIVESHFLNTKIKSYEINKINFIALTQAVKGKSTIIFGTVDPEHYGAFDMVQRQKQIDIWKRFGYRFEDFEVVNNDNTDGKFVKPMFGRFESIDEGRTIYNILSEKLYSKPQQTEIDNPMQSTSFIGKATRQTCVIVFVIDTSESMRGFKIDQAKKGLMGALKMSQNNHVGLISFNDDVFELAKVEPLANIRQSLSDRVRDMSAEVNRCTALYDGIKAGIVMADSAPAAGIVSRMVVVLTDGQANRGQGLYNIIKTKTVDGLDVKYSGFEADAIDNKGRTVSRENIKGVGLAVSVEHNVQIYYIGIGDDADMEIGRLLAEATGAESMKGSPLNSIWSGQRVKKVRDVDIARILEEFKYF